MSEYSIFQAPEIPPGYCHCGCGHQTNIATRTRRCNHMHKGQPLTYLRGHGTYPPFWARLRDAIQVAGPDECWPWQKAKVRHGYGSISDKSTTEKRSHRVVYELVFGPIPEGMEILHTCDNASCCNPAHLRLGTQADNVRDMKQKGREADRRGIKNGRARLNEDAVRDIRRQYANGTTRQALANSYDVGWQAIDDITSGRSWLHVA